MVIVVVVVVIAVAAAAAVVYFDGHRSSSSSNIQLIGTPAGGADALACRRPYKVFTINLCQTSTCYIQHFR